MLKRFLLMFFLAIPLSGYSQSYAGSPFYRPISAIPATAHVEGWAHGIIKANGVMIDLSVSEPSTSPDSDKSGDAISFTMLPLGHGKVAVVHYIRFTRSDLAPASTE